MLSSNQKCNAFASVIGIFCHATNTPEKVIKVLSRLGVSISLNAIHSAIKSLSEEAYSSIRDLGQSLTAVYAYDNFDIEINVSVPTAEKGSESSLKHLTSGLLFSLPQGTTADDLNWSNELWRQSRLNDELPDNRPELEPLPDWQNLFLIHPTYYEIDDKGMTARDRFNSEKFFEDLVEYRPEYFHQFRSEHRDLEVYVQVPIEKTNIIPARAMNVSNSTVSGNIQAIEQLMQQGGVGDPSISTDPDIRPLDNHAVLVAGDLGTGERIASAKVNRSIENSPHLRFQFVIFVLGLFHLQMACVDAIWRIFIHGAGANTESTSVMAHAAILRPRETGKIQSNPGFRRMHQLVQHIGICRRLDCWRVLCATRNPEHSDLQKFAASLPTLETLREMADYLALNFVANPALMQHLHDQPSAVQDQQYEHAVRDLSIRRRILILVSSP